VIGYFNASTKLGTWLGGVYNDTLSTWQWLNGEPWEFEYFESGHTYRDNDRLVFRKRQSSPERKWGGVTTDKLKYVLCERAP